MPAYNVHKCRHANVYTSVHACMHTCMPSDIHLSAKLHLHIDTNTQSFMELLPTQAPEAPEALSCSSEAAVSCLFCRRRPGNPFEIQHQKAWGSGSTSYLSDLKLRPRQLMTVYTGRLSICFGVGASPGWGFGGFKLVLLICGLRYSKATPHSTTPSLRVQKPQT